MMRAKSLSLEQEEGSPKIETLRAGACCNGQDETAKHRAKIEKKEEQQREAEQAKAALHDKSGAALIIFSLKC